MKIRAIGTVVLAGTVLGATWAQGGGAGAGFVRRHPAGAHDLFHNQRGTG